MKKNKILVVLVTAFLVVALSSVAAARDKATGQEVVAKVKEAASALSKTGDMTQFNQKQGPWVWKDSYIFIQDCGKKLIAAHPIKSEQIGQPLTSVKDAKTGESIFSDGWCEKVESSPSGSWDEYWWPKPGESEPSRKLACHLRAKGTDYVVSAGIYDDKATIAELSKLTGKK